MHMIKIGSLYLTPDGGLSPRQCDALRVVRLDAGNLSPRTVLPEPRFVKLRPRAVDSQDAGQDIDTGDTRHI